ncbi:MAG: hypothetical protein QXH80_04675 [Candidatus Nanoarchaeia archaeon]
MKINRRKFLKIVCSFFAGLPLANFAKTTLFQKINSNLLIYAVPGKYPGKILTKFYPDKHDWNG